MANPLDGLVKWTYQNIAVHAKKYSTHQAVKHFFLNCNLSVNVVYFVNIFRRYGVTRFCKITAYALVVTVPSKVYLIKRRFPHGRM